MRTLQAGFFPRQQPPPPQQQQQQRQPAAAAAAPRMPTRMGGLDDIDLDEAGWEDEEDDEEDEDAPGFLGGMGFGFAGLPGFLGGGAMPQASRGRQRRPLLLCAFRLQLGGQGGGLQVHPHHC